MTMTAPAPSDVFRRLAELDDATLATVTAAYGRTPSVSEADPDEVARLDAVISAVIAGQQQPAAPAVPVEQVPELPPLPPPDVDPLRARVRALDEQHRNALLHRWTDLGLPGLAHPDGSSVTLDAETHHSIEQLIASAEPPVDPSVATELKARWKALPAGPRMEVEARLAGQGIADTFANPVLFTSGRALTLEQMLDAVEAEADRVVADALGPVADGRIVTTPVDDADALAEVPPDGKVAEVLAWVGGNATRARAALDAERARAKPRTSLVDKLAPLAGGPGTPPPAAPAPVQQVAPVGGDASGESGPTAAVDATPSSPAGASPRLESELFRATPVSEWGPLTRVAYLRQLAAELEVAAGIFEQLAVEVHP